MISLSRMPKRVTRKKRNHRRRKHSRGSKKLRGGNPSPPSPIQYPPSSINNYISHVLYINLDHRTDRKDQIEKELQVFPPEKVIRIPGVVDTNKRKGCATSHLNALKYARDHNFSNVLIVEDDAMWSSIEAAYPVFEKLIKNPYDVIMLGATQIDYNDNTYKINKAYTTSSYLVNSSYYTIIINKIQELLNKPEYQTLSNCGQAIDCETYHTLQSTGNWFIVVPSLMIQRPGYSNIEQIHTSYVSMF